MQIRAAEFEALAVGPGSWPAEGPPEIAFAGRSNVGKSSLINALCQRKRLARTSSTPGRTRALVFFRVEPAGGEPVRFVDLPGYGYAKTSKEERASWRPLVEAFLLGRPTLRLVIVLVDARRGVEDEERDLVEWLAQAGLPLQVVHTKCDAIPRNRRHARADAVRKTLDLSAAPIDFSVPERRGADALWRAIDAALGVPPDASVDAPKAGR
jgi:GTP-binding protein